MGSVALRRSIFDACDAADKRMFGRPLRGYLVGRVWFRYVVISHALVGRGHCQHVFAAQLELTPSCILAGVGSGQRAGPAVVIGVVIATISANLFMRCWQA